MHHCGKNGTPVQLVLVPIDGIRPARLDDNTVNPRHVRSVVQREINRRLCISDSNSVGRTTVYLRSDVRTTDRTFSGIGFQ